jgi:DNA-directed RNA polymerase specialized sigma24 family protein
MTPHSCTSRSDGPFDALSRHVRLGARSPAGDHLVARLFAFGIRVEADEQLVSLLARNGEKHPSRVALVEALAVLAPSDELAALMLVDLLRPDLQTLAAKLVRSAGPTLGEAEGEVVAAAWETLTCRPPPHRKARLDAIWKTLRRTAQLGRMELTVPLPNSFDVAVPDEWALCERWSALVDTAGSDGTLSRYQAALIVRTRVDGVPLSELARELGRPYDAVRKERRRAEMALRSYVRSGGRSRS